MIAAGCCVVVAALASGDPGLPDAPRPVRASHEVPVAALSLEVVPPAVGMDPTTSPFLLRRIPATGFVPNVGQWDGGVRHVAQIGPLLVRVEDAGLLLVNAARLGLPGLDDCQRVVGDAVRLTFGRSLADVAIEAEGVVAGRHSFILGSDPTKWVRNVTACATLRLVDVSPGIDLVLRDVGETLEYDVVLRPGANLSEFAIECEGHVSLSLDTTGDLLLGTAHGMLRQPAPRSWEVLPDGSMRPVACRYRILGSNCYAFDVEGHDGRSLLVIDPVVQWATFVGGTGAESGNVVAVVPNGDVVVAASSLSVDYPFTPGAFDVVSDSINGDGTITRFTADGAGLVYSTFYGGSGLDGAFAIEILADESVLVGGVTGSSDLPVTPGAFDSTYGGGGTTGDTFVARFTADGTDLVFSTYLGGELGDAPYDMALAPDGTIVLAGRTCSDDFPTTPGAYSTVENGHCDGFITAMSSDGSSLVFSTYLGASGINAEDLLTGVDVEPNGSVVVVGTTMENDYPTTPDAAEPTATGTGKKGVLSRLSADGGTLLYSSYMGTVFAPGKFIPNFVRVDADGTLLVIGEMLGGIFVGPGLPATEGSFQPTKPGGSDPFISRLDPSGKTFLKSTYVGSIGNDYLDAVHIDPAGRIYLGGQAKAGFPITPNAFDSAVNTSCGADGFVAVLEPDLTTYRYGSFIGNSTISCTMVDSVTSDGCGGLVVTAWEAGPTWPTTTGAFDTTYNGGSSDAWVARLQALDPWTALPGGASGSLGVPALRGEGPPCSANEVSLLLGDALPSAPLFLVIGLSRLDAPFKGGTLVPAPDLILVGFTTDAQGDWSITAAWPAGVPSGLDVYFQAWILDGGAPKGYAGSNGVLLDVF